jgi:hypothetical protein
MMAPKKKAKAKTKMVKGVWTKSDVNTLKKMFPNTPTAKIAAKLCRSTDNVKKKASRMELRKAKSYMKTLGRG